MTCSCHQQRSGISGYKVLTIDGLHGVGGRTIGALGAPATASGGPASQAGFQAGYEGGKAMSKAPAYVAAYQRGQAARKAAPPQPRSNGAAVMRKASYVVGEDGLPVPTDGEGEENPGVPELPPGQGKALPPGAGGPTTTYCAQDTGQGGWRQVGGEWRYAHHEGLILSSLAAKYLGDGSAWKQIWNGSKERGYLPNNATPDRIPVRDASGDRVTFYMPPAAVEKARALGCIPSSAAVDALKSVPTWVWVAGGVVLAGGGLYLATGHD